jgi:methyl-accepting chemotaxis protein
MSYSFTTAKDLIEIKIQYNKLITELLKTENDILKHEIIIRYRISENNINKIKNIEKINDIESQQLDKYDLNKEDEISVLTESINNSSIEVNSLIQEIKNLKNKILDLSTQINNVKNKIPERTVVTNFKFVMYDPNDNCHKVARK